MRIFRALSVGFALLVPLNNPIAAEGEGFENPGRQPRSHEHQPAIFRAVEHVLLDDQITVSIAAARRFWIAEDAIIRADTAVLEVLRLAYAVVVTWHDTLAGLAVRSILKVPVRAIVPHVAVVLDIALLARIQDSVPAQLHHGRWAVFWITAAVAWACPDVLTVFAHSVATTWQVRVAIVTIIWADGAVFAAHRIAHAVPAGIARSTVRRASYAVLTGVWVALSIATGVTTVHRTDGLEQGGVLCGLTHPIAARQTVVAVCRAGSAILADCVIAYPITTAAFIVVSTVIWVDARPIAILRGGHDVLATSHIAESVAQTRHCGITIMAILWAGTAIFASTHSIAAGAVFGAVPRIFAYSACTITTNGKARESASCKKGAYSEEKHSQPKEG